MQPQQNQNLIAANTTPTILRTCTDSDGGKNFETKGKVTIKDSREFSYPDTCYPYSANYVIEYYCIDNRVAVITQPCISNCKDGACKPAQTKTASTAAAARQTVCVDTDNGEATFVKGTVTDRFGKTATDTCVAGKKLTEFSCSKTGGIANKQYSCLLGCSDGACRPIPKTIVASRLDFWFVPREIMTPDHATTMVGYLDGNGAMQYVSGDTMGIHAAAYTADGGEITSAMGFAIKTSIYDADNNVVTTIAGGKVPPNGGAVRINANTGSYDFSKISGPKTYTIKAIVYCADPAKGYCSTANPPIEKTLKFIVTKPAITLDFPNGGERIAIGNPESISYTISGAPHGTSVLDIDTNFRVDLMLYKSGKFIAFMNKGDDWGSGGPAGSYYTSKFDTKSGRVGNHLETAAPGSDYKILALLYRPGFGYIAGDESDGYFTLY